MVSERASRRAFFGLSALLFAASAAVRIVWRAPIPAMGEMPMPTTSTQQLERIRSGAVRHPRRAAGYVFGQTRGP